MSHLNTTYFAAASNMSPNQIQQLFSPIVPGQYANNLVFPPSLNPQEAIFRAIEALRQSTPANEKQPVALPTIDMFLAHG